MNKKQLRLAILEVIAEITEDAAATCSGVTDGWRNARTLHHIAEQKLKQAREEVRK